MQKFIFVTGGVVSSVGKGICVASIGRMLKSRGLSVSLMKLDPYLNVDPGTMSPYQHGEVFVTDDGAETDLDLGHYERFTETRLDGLSSLTAGQIYKKVIDKERRGDFLGRTIQVVPHVTNEIKDRIIQLSESSNSDIIVAEVGGTVGDIEGLPFLESIRQIPNFVGKENCFYIHVTYLPFINTTGELKTKPTQHSVRELRSIGIHPDSIICRSEFDVSEKIKEKISMFCDVSLGAVVSLPTLDSVYEVPVRLEEENLGKLLSQNLSLNDENGHLDEWISVISKANNSKNTIKLAIVGKYVELQDSYLSVKESLIHAGISNNAEIQIEWINSEEINSNNINDIFNDIKGIIVPGGFDKRGTQGMINACRYARENKIPYFGLCLGMQIMVIEAARNLLGYEDSNSTEFDETTPFPVIDLMPEQLKSLHKGGSMRLGLYECNLADSTYTKKIYKQNKIKERHRHRYEVNNKYVEELKNVKLIPSGIHPEGDLVEIMEYSNHPFMIGVQFHPEFLSTPLNPHPLFVEFVKAALNDKHSKANKINNEKESKIT
jgi:CTP synthase|tara:strand:+ start:9073 stop:10719 length:1647 start_codon:yes stop_codon:yes gene_type:complete